MVVRLIGDFVSHRISVDMQGSQQTAIGKTSDGRIYSRRCDMGTGSLDRTAKVAHRKMTLHPFRGLKNHKALRSTPPLMAAEVVGKQFLRGGGRIIGFVHSELFGFNGKFTIFFPCENKKRQNYVK